MHTRTNTHRQNHSTHARRLDTNKQTHPTAGAKWASQKTQCNFLPSFSQPNNKKKTRVLRDRHTSFSFEERREVNAWEARETQHTTQDAHHLPLESSLPTKKAQAKCGDRRHISPPLLAPLPPLPSPRETATKGQEDKSQPSSSSLEAPTGERRERLPAVGPLAAGSAGLNDWGDSSPPPGICPGRG